MKFRTEIEVKKELELKPDFKLVTFGSCFADRIGDYFGELGIQSHLNPYGVIYNPISISKLLDASLDDSLLGTWEENNNLWLNTMYHGQFSNALKDLAEEKLKAVVTETSDRLKDADLLIITFGTSFAYRDVESGEIVTNCHRLPSSRFERVLLSIEQMFSSMKASLERILKKNPNLKVILTASPVRHVRDSLVKNQLSKAQLSCIVHKLVEEIPAVHYFPSYEILMDDLRDYRFYDEGLVQPNSQALGYIQEKFRDFAFTCDLETYEEEASLLLKKLRHRSINQSSETERFQQKTQNELKDFLKKYPFSILNGNSENFAFNR